MFFVFGDVDIFVFVGFEGDSIGIFFVEIGFVVMIIVLIVGCILIMGSILFCEEKKRKKRCKGVVRDDWMDGN